MENPKEQAQCAKIPRVSAISGTFYARRVCIYRTTVHYTEERTSVPLETNTPDVYGQYQDIGM